MTSGHTISQVAAKTGFTTSALRFYEDAGLIAPRRTDAGYRIYDDRSVERLRFISRAKQLGLSLDEISELVALWDGDPCSSVAARLGELVDEKIRDAQDRIAELVSLTADLQRARATMSSAIDEPCGDACACQRDEDRRASVGAALIAKPAAPITCTLAPDQTIRRVDDWQELLARAESRTPVDGGLEIRFPCDSVLAAEVARLAAAEQSCCSFFTFTLRIDRTGTSLTVRAPAEAAVSVDALFGAAA